MCYVKCLAPCGDLYETKLEEHSSEIWQIPPGTPCTLICDPYSIPVAFTYSVA
jgi:hypothetical protein